jgi:hypothetical protein
LRREGERDERPAQERHRQDDQVHQRGGGLLGLGERPTSSPIERKASVPQITTGIAIHQ